MEKTILHDLHTIRGAKMAEFGGYEMPVQYESAIKEYEAARTGAAVFDTCHMGEFKVSGVGALDVLEKTLSCDVADIKTGACKYGFMCNDNGGVIDDMLIYRMDESDFMLVTNAANESAVNNQLVRHASDDTHIENASASIAKIDVQGPKAPKIVAALFEGPIAELKFYNFAENIYKNAKIIVSRTGYTGEIGFEIYCPVAVIRDFWNDCIVGGAIPAGLGARDMLRLEMGFPLYGHELSAERNAAESGFARVISVKKDFIGAQYVRAPETAKQLLRGISFDGRRTARQGNAVLSDSGETIGTATSGSFSPMLGHAIALAYINREYAEMDTVVKAAVGNSEISGRICQLPFYKNATARADLKLYL